MIKLQSFVLWGHQDSCLFPRFIDALKFSQQEIPNKYGCAEMNKKKIEFLQHLHFMSNLPFATKETDDHRLTTCPNFQSKQQIGFACTLHDPGPSVLLTLDLTLGTLQQFSSFLSACETPQTGVRHWSNTSTDKRLIFPRATRKILPRKQILCRHVPRKAI